MAPTCAVLKAGVSLPYLARKWSLRLPPFKQAALRLFTAWIEMASVIVSISAVRDDVTNTSYGRNHSGRPASE